MSDDRGQPPAEPQGDLAGVIDIAAHVEEAARYAQAVTDAVEELDWMSGTLIATALGLEDLHRGGDLPVGMVVIDPQQALAHSVNWRVRKILDLSNALLAGAEALGLAKPLGSSLRVGSGNQPSSGATSQEPTAWRRSAPWAS